MPRFFSHAQIHAKAILQLLRREYINSEYPSAGKLLRIVDALSNAVDDKKPLSGVHLHNAAIIDNSCEGYPLLRALLSKGAVYNKHDVAAIRKFNQSAADLLGNYMDEPKSAQLR